MTTWMHKETFRRIIFWGNENLDVIIVSSLLVTAILLAMLTSNYYTFKTKHSLIPATIASTGITMFFVIGLIGTKALNLISENNYIFTLVLINMAITTLLMHILIATSKPEKSIDQTQLPEPQSPHKSYQLL